MRKLEMPLGEIMLDGGPKSIEVMHDMFLNYHFKRKENWPHLLRIVNTFIRGCGMEEIDMDAEVEAQYERFVQRNAKVKRLDFLSKSRKKPRDVGTEFQRRAYPQEPIRTRSPAYFGLGMANDPERACDQIWLMAEDNAELMLGRKYMAYSLNGGNGEAFPGAAGKSKLLFVSLQLLAREDSDAGEMALLLLGHGTDPGRIRNPCTKEVAENLLRGFKAFKKDKEAKNIMSTQERWLAEGRAEGKIEGKIEMCFKDFDMAIDAIAKKLGMAEEYVTEVLAKLGLLESGGKAGN